MKQGNANFSASFGKPSFHLIKPSELAQFDFSPISTSYNLEKIDFNSSDLNSLISNIIETLDNNPATISTDQYQQVLSTIMNTLEVSTNGLDNIIKIQNLPNIQYDNSYAPKMEQILSFIMDYIRLTTKIYNSSVLYTHSVCPFIMFFINMSTIFIDIYQNPNTIFSTKDFQMAWSDNYYVSLRLPKFLKELGIQNHFFTLSKTLKLKELMPQISSCQFNNFIASYHSLESNVAKFKLDDLQINLLKNIIIDIQDTRLNLIEYLHIPKEQPIGPNDTHYEKIEALNQFESIIEMYLSLLHSVEMVKKINQLIQNESFDLPRAADFSEQTKFICTQQLIENIHMNTRLLQSIYALFKQADPASIEANKRSKEILNCIANHTNATIDDQINLLLSVLSKIKPITDESIVQVFIQFYTEQIESQKDNMNELFLRGKLFFDKFRFITKIFQDTPNLFTASSRFASFSNFEDYYRYLQTVSGFENLSSMNDTLLAYRFVLMSHVCFLSNKLMMHCLIALKPTCPIPYYQEHFMINELSSYLNNFLTLFQRIRHFHLYNKESETFIDYFIHMLRVLSFFLNSPLNQSEEFLSYLLSSFPSVEVVKEKLSLQNLIDYLKTKIGTLQASAISVQEFNYQTRNKISFPITNEFQATSEQLIESRTRLSDICSLVEKLEYIKLCLQLFVLYDNFFNQFVSSIERNFRIIINEEPIVMNQILIELPKFSRYLLFLLKSCKTKEEISLYMSKLWINLYRAVLLNQDVKISADYANLLIQIPFFDCSALIRKSFLHIRKIDSCILLDLQTNMHGKQVDSIITLYLHITTKLRKMLIGTKYEKVEFDRLMELFLSQLFKISPEFYRVVQKNWAFVSEMIYIYERIHQFSSLVDRQSQLDLFFIINLFKSIHLSLIEVVKSKHVSIDFIETEKKFAEKIAELGQNYQYMFRDMSKERESIYFSIIDCMQELKNDFLNVKIEQFTDPIRCFLAENIPLIAAAIPSTTYGIFEEIVKDMIVQIDSLEELSADHVFPILFKMRSKVKKLNQFNIPILNEFCDQVMVMIVSEINISLLQTQILTYHLFLLQCGVDNPAIINRFISIHLSFNQIMDVPVICKIPEISANIDRLINKYCPKEDGDGLLQSFKENLSNLKREGDIKLLQMLKSLKIDISKLNAAETIIDSYQKTKSEYIEQANQLRELKEQSQQLNHQKIQILKNFQMQLTTAKNQASTVLQEYKKCVDAKALKTELISKSTERRKRLESLLALFDQQTKNVQNMLNYEIPSEPTEKHHQNISQRKDGIGFELAIGLEEKFQKELDKNNALWMQAKYLMNDKKEEPQKPKEKVAPVKIDPISVNHSLGTTRQNVNDKYDTLVETVYEIFRRCKFCKEALFSQERRINPLLLPNRRLKDPHGVTNQDNFDDEEAIDLLLEFTNELFDKSLKFYFTNKLFKQMKEKKIKRKIKVKKPKKSILSKLLDEELQSV